MNDALHTALVLVSLMLAACGSGSKADLEMDRAGNSARPPAPYEPGLGDLMSTLQLRHAKLWYAGQAQNWELVQFELHETNETFERVARWHPEEDGILIAPSLEGFMRAATNALEQSAENKDPVAFETAFDRLTDGCNGCHQTMKHGFIAIQRPSAEPVSNQKWAP